MRRDERPTETERRARELFDASVEGLDAGTRSRLHRARQSALLAAGRPRRFHWRAWGPAAALASVALMAVLLWRPPGQGVTPAAGDPVGEPVDEALELFADGDDVDLVEDDLEFYRWLDEAGLPVAGGAG